MFPVRPNMFSDTDVTRILQSIVVISICNEITNHNPNYAYPLLTQGANYRSAKQRETRIPQNTGSRNIYRMLSNLAVDVRK